MFNAEEFRLLYSVARALGEDRGYGEVLEQVGESVDPFVHEAGRRILKRAW